MFDINKVRNDFPMIRNNQDLIYFDNSATTYKPDSVINAVNSFYSEYTSNVERGDYSTAIKADKAYDNTRKIVSKLINSEPKEIAFTANITASLNQLVYGLSYELNKDDVVYVSYSEHASNLLPWFRLQKEKGIIIKYIPMDDQGNILLDKFFNELNNDVKVISFAYIGNVLGVIQPAKKIIQEAHKYGIKVIIDAAQAIGHIKIDVKDLDCDYLCFSGHKMLGPDGVGVIYGKYNLLKDMPPLLLGGGMNARFDAEGNIIYKDAPQRFEAGTPNIEGVIGLGKACEYLMDLGLDNIHEYVLDLRKYLYDKAKDLDNIVIYNPDVETGILTFNVKDVFAQDAAGYLAANNICVRSGNHCAKILHNLIGSDQSIRASLYFYNTYEEIDKFVECVSKINLDNAVGIFF